MICLLPTAFAFAQNLNTTDVADQFDSDFRGQETSGCGITYGGACEDGSDAVTITNQYGVTGAISYVNTWAGASGSDGANGESPVLDITAAHVHPDRNTALAGIPANTRPGATSPTKAVLICDDGGHNGLFLGGADDSAYYIEVDVYCPDRSGELTTDQYEAVSACVRAASREGGWMDYTFNMDRTGSYAIVYDEILRTIEAVTWARNTTIGVITSRDPASRTIHGTLTDVAAGWHTFKIACAGDQVKFWVDGTPLAAITDATYSAGYAGLVIREGGVDGGDERPGYFDNLKAGPFSIPVSGVESFEIYD